MTHARSVAEDLLLSRQGVSLLLALVRRYEQLAARVDGTAQAARSSLLGDVVAALEAVHRGDDSGFCAVMFGDEPADSQIRASSDPVVRADDRVTIKEASVVLGYCEQHTRRLANADAFGLRRIVPQSTTVARSEVTAYLACRSQPT